MRRRVLELDGLRAFAILPVLLFHFAPETGFLSWFAPLCRAGWAGVDLFFVLSGYLITNILLDRVGTAHYYRDFLARRALRIFPLYYLCLALFTAAVYLASDQTFWHEFEKWGGPGWYAIYLGNVRTAVENSYPPVFTFGLLWSLQVEEQFYVFYPWLISRLTLQTLRTLLFAAVGLALLFRGLAVVFVPDNWLICYVLTPCRMDALAMGALVALATRDNRQPVRIGVLTGAFWAGLVAVVAMFWGISTYAGNAFVRSLGYSLIDVTCAAALLIVLATPEGFPSRALRWQPLVYTGQIAYGLYLLHGPASWIARTAASRFFPIQALSTTNLLISLPASFLVAHLSWKFFESRILALKTKRASSPPLPAFSRR
jgi:peptidoglycan/LPS O-acetylase OafA/YrhL